MSDACAAQGTEALVRVSGAGSLLNGIPGLSGIALLAPATAVDRQARGHPPLGILAGVIHFTQHTWVFSLLSLSADCPRTDRWRTTWRSLSASSSRG